MRRICCFCETWESGGIESFLNNILLHMDLTDMEVDIVAACVKHSIFTQNLEGKGIRVLELSGRLRSPGNYPLFRKLLQERAYDVVHFNLFQGMSLYYVQIAKEEGVPIRIAHSHNTALRKSKGRWLKMLLHKLGSSLYASAATEFWACSGAAAKFLFPAGDLKKKNYRFIPNGIDVERFKFNQTMRDEVRAKLGISDAFVIGNIGRLCYQKNQSFLIELMPELLERRPNAKLLLVGEGEDKGALVRQTKALGVSGNVLFYGITDEPEKLYCAMDVFAFPSRFEGLGIVAIEAQANGLPVVCSQFVPPETKISELAITVPIEHGVEAWADVVCKYAGHRELTVQKNTHIGQFDIHKVSGQVRAIFCDRQKRS